MTIWVPLQGPSGVKPKAPSMGAWQSPGYHGLDLAATDGTEWVGMRCDDWVVIDPDCGCEKVDGIKPEVCTTQAVATAAFARWQERDPDALKGWVRKTPHGFHIIYKADHGVEGMPHAPNADILGKGSHLDIRAGRTSQIVFYAPGYKDLTPESSARWFDPRWMPENFGSVQIDRSGEEAWSEMPEGRGNNTMAAFAGAFRKQGMDLTTMVKCLAAINKITMTDDPMPLEMVIDIAKSVNRYSARPDIDIAIDDDDD